MAEDDKTTTPTVTMALPGLARTLVAAGKLDARRAEDIYAKAQAQRTSFISELVGSGAVSSADLAHTMSQAFAAPLLDLDAVDIKRLPEGVLDPKVCQQARILVLSKRSNRLTIATADPSDHQALEKIKFSSQLGVDWVIAEYDKLSKLVDAASVTAGEAIDHIVGGEFEFDETSVEMTSGDAADKVSAEVEDAPVVRFLQKMLLDAFSMRASDLHFEPYEHNYRVRFRIDGELREIASPPVAIKDKLASRIKVISKMDISEKRVPQDGRMKLKFGNKAIDFRVSTLPTLFGEKIVIRILDPSSAKLGIEALGYEPEEKVRLMDAIKRPYGMVLVTGPTGSGKTVSLYTCLNILNQPGVNIATVEDPAEINLPGINQVNVNDKAGLTFAAALESGSEHPLAEAILAGARGRGLTICPAHSSSQANGPGCFIRPYSGSLTSTIRPVALVCSWLTHSWVVRCGAPGICPSPKILPHSSEVLVRKACFIFAEIWSAHFFGSG